MENAITAAIGRYRSRTQAIIDQADREAMDLARIAFMDELTKSPESMWECLADRMGALELDYLLTSALHALLVASRDGVLPDPLFRLWVEQVKPVVDAAARKAVG